MTNIYDLPDELLSEILEIASTTWTKWSIAFHYKYYEPVAVFARVNRHFHRLAQPLLYKILNIMCSGVALEDNADEKALHVPTVTMCLRRSLLYNKELRQLCRRLRLQFYPPNAKERLGHRMDIAAEFISWCTASISFETSFLLAPWPLVQKALHDMPHLQRLALHPGLDRRGMDLPRLISMVNDVEKMRSLKIVTATGVDRTLKEKAGTSSITELEFVDFSDSPAYMSDLVRWPAKLEVFILSDTEGFKRFPDIDKVTDNWRLPLLHSVLVPQQKNLRYIRVRHLIVDDPRNPAHPGLAGFDLRSFSALTHLTLARQTTGTNPRFIHFLLAPRLRVFSWDLTTPEPGQPTGLGELCDVEENWLRALAHAREAAGTSTMLRRVDIMYEPSPTCGPYYFGCLGSRGGGNGNVYPWDRLKRLAAQDMREAGIELVWDPPTISRREFGRLVAII